MGDKRIMLVSWQLRYNMTNSSFELAAFLVPYFSFCQLILLVDRGLLILLMCLDWKISGLERPSNFKESVFQAIPFPLHVHPTCTSLVGKKLERAPEMRECHTQRHPEEIHWEEDNGRISSLQLMYCEYHLFWLKNFIFVHALIIWHLLWIMQYHFLFILSFLHIPLYCWAHLLFPGLLLYIFYADCWNGFLFVNPLRRVFIGQAATQGKLLLWGAKVRFNKKL